jgi:serine/threonine protein kinase
MLLTFKVMILRLVYELMPNASLEEWLHSTHHQPNNAHEPRSLNLTQRLDISIDVANALDYLHHHCHTPIVHCDLKPSNVLLDGGMTASVGDFGLARLQPEVSGQLSSDQTSSIGLKGTIGYAAPGKMTRVSLLLTVSIFQFVIQF